MNLTIGDLARQTGVKIPTIRYYEQVGLLPEPPRTEGKQRRYGTEFAAVLTRSRVWINGDDAPDGAATELHEGDEIAVLPPVSGGCGRVARHTGAVRSRW